MLVLVMAAEHISSASFIIIISPHRIYLPDLLHHWSTFHLHPYEHWPMTCPKNPPMHIVFQQLHHLLIHHHHHEAWKLLEPTWWLSYFSFLFTPSSITAWLYLDVGAGRYISRSLLRVKGSWYSCDDPHVVMISGDILTCCNPLLQDRYTKPINLTT